MMKCGCYRGDMYLTGEVKAAVYSSGTILWIPPVRAYILCQRDDDITNCTMKYATFLARNEFPSTTIKCTVSGK